MAHNMNHDEAVKLAQEIDARYELRCSVRDFESKDDPSLNHSYLGIWSGDQLLFSLNDRSQWEAIRDFAYKMVQTDADLRQEEQFVEVEQSGDTIDMYNTMARSLGDIPLRDVGQYQ